MRITTLEDLAMFKENKFNWSIFLFGKPKKLYLQNQRKKKEEKKTFGADKPKKTVTKNDRIKEIEKLAKDVKLFSELDLMIIAISTGKDIAMKESCINILLKAAIDHKKKNRETLPYLQLAEKLLDKGDGSKHAQCDVYKAMYDYWSDCEIHLENEKDCYLNKKYYNETKQGVSQKGVNQREAKRKEAETNKIKYRDLYNLIEEKDLVDLPLCEGDPEKSPLIYGEQRKKTNCCEVLKKCFGC